MRYRIDPLLGVVEEGRIFKSWAYLELLGHWSMLSKGYLQHAKILLSLLPVYDQVRSLFFYILLP